MSPAAHAIRSNRARGLFAVTALLCLFAQLSVLAHLSLAKHGLCLDHGELTEVVEQTPAPATPPALRRVQPSKANSVELPRGATILSSDEHCSLAQLIRQIDPGQTATLLRLPAEVLPVAVVAREVAWPQSGVLAFAPKQSPPV